LWKRIAIRAHFVVVVRGVDVAWRRHRNLHHGAANRVGVSGAEAPVVR
jgi:hypothetical protein